MDHAQLVNPLKIDLYTSLKGSPKGWACYMAVAKALTHLGQQLPSPAELLLQVEHLFVIGGGQVYREAIASPRCGVIHFTQIQADLECDTFFPAIDPARWAVACACCTRPCKVGSKRAAPCGWAASALDCM